MIFDQDIWHVSSSWQYPGHLWRSRLYRSKFRITGEKCR